VHVKHFILWLSSDEITRTTPREEAMTLVSIRRDAAAGTRLYSQRRTPGVLEGVQIAGVDRSVHPQQCLCIIDTEPLPIPARLCPIRLHLLDIEDEDSCSVSSLIVLEGSKIPTKSAYYSSLLPGFPGRRQGRVPQLLWFNLPAGNDPTWSTASRDEEDLFLCRGSDTYTGGS